MIWVSSVSFSTTTFSSFNPPLHLAFSVSHLLFATRALNLSLSLWQYCFCLLQVCFLQVYRIGKFNLNLFSFNNPSLLIALKMSLSCVFSGWVVVERLPLRLSCKRDVGWFFFSVYGQKGTGCISLSLLITVCYYVQSSFYFWQKYPSFQ